MKKTLFLSLLFCFFGSGLFASYFASGEFEAVVTEVVAYSTNKEGEVQLTLKVELIKLITSGGHNKDHAKQLLGSSVDALFIIDPKVTSIKAGDKVKVIWNYGNGLTPKGVTEFTIWRVAPNDKP